MARLLLRAVWTPAWTTCALAVALLTLAGLGQVLLASSITPPPRLLGAMLLGAAGSVAPLALAVGALAGAAGGIARLRDERALLALSAAGLPTGRVAWLIGALLLPAALAQAGLGHFVEPLSRASLRDSRASAAAAVHPRADRPVRLGSWWLALDGDALVFTDGVATGRAAGWTLSARQGGVLAELRDVDWQAGGGRVLADQLVLPIPLANRGKVHVSERTTPDLLRQLAVSASLGRDALERWLLWKRSVLPALLVPLGIAAAGFARRSGAGPVVGALLIGSWVAVRLCDAAIGSLGAPASAAGLLATGSVVAAWAWRR